MTQPLAQWARPLALATAIVFCISSAFPVVAAFVKDKESWPKWWGLLDVGIVILLALLAFALLGITQGRVNKEAEQASYRAYRVLIHGVFLVLVVFVFLGDRIVWSNCLSGHRVARLAPLLLPTRLVCSTRSGGVRERFVSNGKSATQPRRIGL